MKRSLLLLSILSGGVLAVNAQLKNVEIVSNNNALDSKTQMGLVEKLVNPNQPAVRKSAAAPAKVIRKAEGDATLLYSLPTGGLYYGLTDEAYSYGSLVNMVTGAFTDVTFRNYTNDGTQYLNDVTWSWGEYQGEAIHPRSEDVNERGDMTAQGFGQYDFPTLTYNGQDYSYSMEIDWDDDNNPIEWATMMWTAGTEDYIKFRFSDGKGGVELHDGSVSPAIPQLGYYSGFSADARFKTNANFFEMSVEGGKLKFTNSGKKLVGFGQYFSKPLGHVYAKDITAFYWVENLETKQPLLGNTLYADIYTINEEGRLELYASANATDEDVNVISDTFVQIAYKFRMEDDILGPIEGPEILPDEDFIIMFTGFENLPTTNFTGMLADTDGWGGGAYGIVDDGALVTYGFSNMLDNPRFNFNVGFHAAFPVAHYAESNLPEVLFNNEGGYGAGMYDEESGKYYSDIRLLTLSPKDMWDLVEKPEWITDYELDDQYVSNYGIMTAYLQASELPEGMEYRRGNVVFDIMGLEVTIPVLQGVDASGIVEVNNTIKTKDMSIYNLAGQKVKSGFKGLTIQEGKKYIAK